MRVGIFKGVTGGAERFREYFDLYANELRLIDFGCAPVRESFDAIRKNGCEAFS